MSDLTQLSFPEPNSTPPQAPKSYRIPILVASGVLVAALTTYFLGGSNLFRGLLQIDYDQLAECIETDTQHIYTGSTNIFKVKEGCDDVEFTLDDANSELYYAGFEYRPDTKSFQAYTNLAADRDPSLLHTTWDFGDNQENLAEDTLNPSHQYAQNGTYTVTFTATYEEKTLTSQKVVTIALPEDQQEAPAETPAADFSPSTPANLHFLEESSTDENGVPYYFVEWDRIEDHENHQVIGYESVQSYVSADGQEHVSQPVLHIQQPANLPQYLIVSVPENGIYTVKLRTVYGPENEKSYSDYVTIEKIIGEPAAPLEPATPVEPAAPEDPAPAEIERSFTREMAPEATPEEPVTDAPPAEEPTPTPPPTPEDEIIPGPGQEPTPESTPEPTPEPLAFMDYLKVSTLHVDNSLRAQGGYTVALYAGNTPMKNAFHITFRGRTFDFDIEEYLPTPEVCGDAVASFESLISALKENRSLLESLPQNTIEDYETMLTQAYTVKGSVIELLQSSLVTSGKLQQVFATKQDSVSAYLSQLAPAGTLPENFEISSLNLYLTQYDTFVNNLLQQISQYPDLLDSEVAQSLIKNRFISDVLGAENLTPEELASALNEMSIDKDVTTNEDGTVTLSFTFNGEERAITMSSVANCGYIPASLHMDQSNKSLVGKIVNLIQTQKGLLDNTFSKINVAADNFLANDDACEFIGSITQIFHDLASEALDDAVLPPVFFNSYHVNSGEDITIFNPADEPAIAAYEALLSPAQGEVSNNIYTPAIGYEGQDRLIYKLKGSAPVYQIGQKLFGEVIFPPSLEAQNDDESPVFGLGFYCFNDRPEVQNEVQKMFTRVNETPAPVTQCSDGIDNDEDGNTDFPADTGCENVEDDTEDPNPVSRSITQCSDGIDNDNNGKIDFGNGPENDAGCINENDDTEQVPSEPISTNGQDQVSTASTGGGGGGGGGVSRSSGGGGGGGSISKKIIKEYSCLEATPKAKIHTFADVQDDAAYKNMLLELAGIAYENDPIVAGRLQDQKYYAAWSEKINRSEAAKFVAKPSCLFASLDKAGLLDSTSKVEFKDLKPTDWAKDIFNALVNINLVQGYADQTIGPDRPITRAEMAKLLIDASALRQYLDKGHKVTADDYDKEAILAEIYGDKIAKYPGSPFPDVKKSDWFYNYSIVAYDMGISKGIDKLFMGDREATRGEVITMVYNYFVSRIK